jgi:transcription-repair coupling factor (superfamily II helicase)
MRDLEIRGAGNILGTAQSGHIVTIGFDLYCALLKQAISKLKGEKTKPRIEVTLRTDFVATREAEFIQSSAADGTSGRDMAPAFLPSSYIAEAQPRIQAYRQLAELSTREQLDQLRKSWRDRYGKLPPAVEHLLTLSAIKLAAAERKITVVDVKMAR